MQAHQIAKHLSHPSCMGSGAERLKTGSVEIHRPGTAHLKDVALPGLVYTGHWLLYSVSMSLEAGRLKSALLSTVEGLSYCKDVKTIPFIL